jgi:alkanesulfonate monooxygenase SsuD/methylene tetrahydromethanopterin reductase-like flavin-dependent oxidoreductase (luciferase family)
MRFGWLTLSLSPSPEEDAVRIDQQIEQVRFAERFGFGDVWLTEHYFTGESVYNDALLFASAVAMRTERIRIGFAVVQLPFHHPVRLAIQLALLDNLSRGRIDVGVGKGTIYNEYEFVGHGLRSEDSRERMEESIDIIGRLWGGRPVTYNGKYFQVQVPQLRPRPVQRPHLPLWRGVVSPASFSECGRLGVPILTARLPVARIKERWAAYEAGLDAGGHDAATKARLLAQSALWRNVYVAESNAQGGGRAVGSAAADPRPHDACPRRVQPGRFHHRPGDAEPLGRSRGRRGRGGQIRARHRIALRFAGAGA